MSNVGDDRWRTPRGQQHNNAANRQQRAPASRDRSSINSLPSQGRPGGGNQRSNSGTVAGNAWNSGDRPNRGGPAAGVMEELHVPARNFNAQETRNILRRGYQDAMGGEEKAMTYKPSGTETNTTNSGGPWTSKPNNMASGQDFFVQLRKGIASLQQPGNAATPP